MKKCLFALYHDINVDGRSLELAKCAMLFGNTTLVTYKHFDNKPDCLSEIIVANGKRSYINYLVECKKIIKEQKPDYLFLENYYDAPLICFAKKHNPKVKIIYDVSELYIGSPYVNRSEGIPLMIKIKQRLSKWLSRTEARNIKYVDVITIPSIERALIFQGYHELNETPVVFDNIHRLDDLIDYKLFDEKYKNQLNDKFVIVYGGGIADSRYTFELCESIASLGKDFLFLICGAASKSEKEKFEKWVADNNIANIRYLGMLKKDEWRYLIQKSHLTVSAYKFYEMNLIFCASGKVYEGFFEGKPLLASNNPPFDSLCKSYGVGVATNDFAAGIIKIRDNYDLYCNNVKQYVDNLSYDSRLQNLKEHILYAIKKHDSCEEGNND